VAGARRHPRHAAFAVGGRALGRDRDGRAGIGVRHPRVRDRGAADNAGHIRFTAAILPPYAQRSRSLEVLIRILY
jgi:hypothetical protein